MRYAICSAIGFGILLGLLPPAARADPEPVYFAGDPDGIGDPNPFYANGVYSIFYLRNRGRHPWWTTHSADLATWSCPVEAIPVGGDAAPDFWTGSGSVVADPAGGYQLFYTGHHPQRLPKEVTMTAHAGTLGGPWTKLPSRTFAGPPAYDARDFRDPFVFWNAERRAWWMLMTTRHDGQAAVGLLSSPDLARWTPLAPLYTESSPLNLEVPDLFREGNDWFLLYSDQRESSRQVRHLHAGTSAGPYRYPAHDALDGRGFYAGRSAGTGRDRMLFGWVAHRRDRTDAGPLDWGGDLVFHAITRTSNGALAVRLPDPVARRFGTVVRRLTRSSPAIGVADRAMLVRASVRARAPGRFGIRIAGRRSGVLEIDAAKGEAEFRIEGIEEPPVQVRFPPDRRGHHTLDLVLDPRLGIGIAYIDHFRALSFRYYGLAGAPVSLFADGGFQHVAGTVHSLSWPAHSKICQ
jgi:hypothetical protein